MKYAFLATIIIMSMTVLAGCAQKSLNSPTPMPQNILQFQVTGYKNGATIPVKYATVVGGGENISIGLKWQKVPAAKSYALLFDDHFPPARNWTHWIVVDIPNTIDQIPEGTSRTNMPAGSRELGTSWGKTGYDGPQAPVGSGPHEYVAHFYALDVEKLSIGKSPTHAEFLKAVDGHTLAEGRYSGFFERK